MGTHHRTLTDNHGALTQHRKTPQISPSVQALREYVDGHAHTVVSLTSAAPGIDGAFKQYQLMPITPNTSVIIHGNPDAKKFRSLIREAFAEVKVNPLDGKPHDFRELQPLFGSAPRALAFAALTAATGLADMTAPDLFAENLRDDPRRREELFNKGFVGIQSPPPSPTLRQRFGNGGAPPSGTH